MPLLMLRKTPHVATGLVADANIVKQYRRLGEASPFASAGMTGLDALGAQAILEAQLCKLPI